LLFVGVEGGDILLRTRLIPHGGVDEERMVLIYVVLVFSQEAVSEGRIHNHKHGMKWKYPTFNPELT
jgi:hypothetical protein